MKMTERNKEQEDLQPAVSSRINILMLGLPVRFSKKKQNKLIIRATLVKRPTPPGQCC